MREHSTVATGHHATRPGMALALLTIVYGFNFLDRQIMGILAQPIKTELNLTDPELGLLGGLAFALLYSTLAVPIAIVADRANRTWIITIALALWSGFTALCGLAQNFTQLFLARVGVGVGEAGGVAPSYSLIADFFEPARRARALAVFSMAVPAGSAAGIVLGGWIAANVDWRTAFIMVGLAGVLFALPFRLLMREPQRGRFDPPSPPPASLIEVMRTLRRKPAFWLLSLGAAASSMMGYGLIFWLPSYFQRSLGLTLLETSQFYGALALFGGVLGIWLGGWLGDRFGSRNRAAYARVPAIAFLLVAPSYALGLSVTWLPSVFLILLVPTALSLLWLGPVIAAVQGMVPPAMRSTASAIFLLTNNLLGIGGGTYFLGRMSAFFADRYGVDSLKYAILAGLPLYVLAALLMWLASRRLVRDWA
jgi:predicted MFS family arabinose efflux permease